LKSFAEVIDQTEDVRRVVGLRAQGLAERDECQVLLEQLIVRPRTAPAFGGRANGSEESCDARAIECRIIED
jgi:hypothetical protein